MNALTKAKLQDGYVAYPWEKRMKEVLTVPNSSSFFSILFLPKATDKAASRYNDIEDTLARAQAWFNSAQATGVSIVLMNIQTESLLTKVITNNVCKRFRVLKLVILIVVCVCLPLI